MSNLASDAIFQTAKFKKNLSVKYMKFKNLCADLHGSLCIQIHFSIKQQRQRTKFFISVTPKCIIKKYSMINAKNHDRITSCVHLDVSSTYMMTTIL